MLDEFESGPTPCEFSLARRWLYRGPVSSCARGAEYQRDDSVESCRVTPLDLVAPSGAQVDAIFKAAAQAANMARIPLAKMTVAETGMGVVEDKVR